MKVTQQNLFDIPEVVNVPKKARTGMRCRNCTHIYRHQYGKMQYCEMQKDPRTSYGHRKIKANAAGCDMFNKKEKKK